MNQLRDKNNVSYTVEKIENFLESPQDHLRESYVPEITLEIRYYPKNVRISFEVDWNNGVTPDGPYAEDHADAYLQPNKYLFPEKYPVKEFEQNKAEILASLKDKIQKKYPSY